ncbi:MAG: sigma-54 dependent transcriptional regulator [Breznakibacter sp.]
MRKREFNNLLARRVMIIDVIEDDKVFNRLIQHTLKLVDGYEIRTWFNGSDFLKNLGDSPEIVTLDLGLPDYSGAEILRRIKKFNPDIDVIVISGQDDVATAVNLLREGAYDYITKDENIKERLLNNVRNIEQKKNLKNEISQLKNEISAKYQLNHAIIGDSKTMENVFVLMEKAIKVPNINVSICGETGTGKELVAKTIHYNSPRRDKPFVAVNMGAIPRELIESELFGHQKGAFTGAILTKKGKFEEATDGTIFLDEIGDMEPDLQVKLLRVLQEREITRVGGNEVIKVSCRVITATNKDLAEESRKGYFREDLYYRLLGLPINLPPLKDRRNDILLLSNHFLDAFCNDNDLGHMLFTERAKKRLLDYAYPGNVRELKAVVELAAVLSNKPEIDADQVVFNNSREEPQLFEREMTLKEYNEHIIRHFLKIHHHNVMKVADILDIGKSTIYNLLKKEKDDNVGGAEDRRGR